MSFVKIVQKRKILTMDSYPHFDAENQECKEHGQFSKEWVGTEIPSWINIDVLSSIIKPESLSIIATDMSLISLR